MEPNQVEQSNETAGAILARLQTLDEEISRLTDLAAKEEDEKRRNQYWDLARDMQAEAREARIILARMPPPLIETRSEPTLRRILKAIGFCMSAAPMRI